MSKVYVSGWWGENLGDDLLLKSLLEKFPDACFITHSGFNGKKQFENYSNIRIINIDSWQIKLINKFLSFLKLPLFQNIVAICSRNYLELGGSIFLEEGDWERKFRNRYKLSKIMKKYIIIGSNFGPSKNTTFINSYKKLFENVDFVNFRDDISKAYFPDLTNISVYPDVVFQLDLDKYIDIKVKKIVNISVISVERMYRYQNQIPISYYEFLSNLCHEYIKKNYKIVLMAYSEVSGDYSAAKKVYTKLSEYDKNFVEIYVHKNIDKSLKLISEAEILIPSRFHGMILGWLLNKKMYVLSYSKKTENTIRFVKKDFPYSEIHKLNKNHVENIIDSVETLDLIHLNHLKELASHHFDILSPLLKE